MCNTYKGEVLEAVATLNEVHHCKSSDALLLIQVSCDIFYFIYSYEEECYSQQLLALTKPWIIKVGSHQLRVIKYNCAVYS